MIIIGKLESKLALPLQTERPEETLRWIDPMRTFSCLLTRSGWGVIWENNWGLTFLPNWGLDEVSHGEGIQPRRQDRSRRTASPSMAEQSIVNVET